MRSILALGLVGIFAITAANNDRYESTEDSFSIVFPATEVTKKEEKIKFEGGEAASRSYKSSRGSSVFQVSVTPLPRETLRNRPLQEVLDLARDGTVGARPGTKAENEQKLLVNGAPARRFLVRTGDLVVVHLLVVTNGRLYHVLSSLPSKLQSEGEEFVRSFSLSAVISGG